MRSVFDRSHEAYGACPKYRIHLGYCSPIYALASGPTRPRRAVPWPGCNASVRKPLSSFPSSLRSMG